MTGQGQRPASKASVQPDGLVRFRAIGDLVQEAEDTAMQMEFSALRACQHAPGKAARVADGRNPICQPALGNDNAQGGGRGSKLSTQQHPQSRRNPHEGRRLTGGNLKRTPVTPPSPAAAAALYDTKFGARRLSSREQELIGKVEDELKAASGRTGIKLPQIVWRVQDTGEVNAYAYAHNRVCFTKGLLHTYGNSKEGIERLAGIAAHEIGHLRNWDTRIGMFLDYLTKPVNIAISALNNTVGRIPYAGLLFIALAWAFRIAAEIAHFLQSSTSQLRELEADHFAHRLMGGSGISGFLDDAARQEEWSGGSVADHLLRSHPAAELRHDRLQKISSAATQR